MTYDALVIGGGPGGSTAATFLAAGGLRVALFERETFPRFHVGESLMPATLTVLDRMGAREAVEAAGFQRKLGATFVDEDAALDRTFYFLRGKPWPHYAYQVTRADFDALLLAHARNRGVEVHQPARVDAAAFDGDGVTLTLHEAGAPARVRGRVLVDASGRDAFVAARFGRRTRVPNLGKVALFAHFRGAARQRGDDEGNIRIHVFREGWFWWIPLAGDLTSVGSVLHARTVRDAEAAARARGKTRTGAPQGDAAPSATDWLAELFATMVARCPAVARGVAGAERVTPVHRTGNFAYRNAPVVGDRFLCVGDAIAFIDPIFSSGVYIAMQTGELAARAVLRAHAAGDFRAARFAPYERAVWRGVRPLFRFIGKYYEPAFFDLLLMPRNVLGMVTAVLSVLSGGSFLRMGWRTRGGLAALYAVARASTWLRRRRGRVVESRLEW